jgi:hypothetical protein
MGYRVEAAGTPCDTPAAANVVFVIWLARRKPAVVYYSGIQPGVREHTDTSQGLCENILCKIGGEKLW